MKAKKFLSMLLVGATAIGILAGCGSETSDSSTDNTAQVESQESTAEDTAQTEPEDGTAEDTAQTESQSSAKQTDGEEDTDTADNTQTDTAAKDSSAGETNTAQEGNGSNILIAYFSVPEDIDTEGMDADAGASVVVKDNQVMGNLEYMAGIIQQTTGGDLFRIETAEEYPLDHEPLVDQAAEEQEEEARPQLASQLENADQYDTILLGYPNWWGDMPMPLYTFLEAYDFSGKTIIPFTAHGGSGFSNTVNTIAELQPGAEVSEDGLSISRSAVADAEDEITSWAEGLGIS